MALEIYSTPEKKKKEFKPISGNKVGMYVCGMTVYDMCHIGHARSQIVFDVISRFLRHKGFDLTYVRNYTDVDDKIIARANKEGVSSQELAERYIDEFSKDMDILRVKKPDIEPRATEHIPQIIEMVKTLIEKGLAYESDGSVYYRVSKFRPYGYLSGRRLEEMIAGARVDIDESKEDPLDFALWKKSKPGEPLWDSPWSQGRPGWHIECSAMSTHYLGPQLDIHGGGKDLMFPHHENEIAQSEGVYEKTFVRYWVHNGFVTINGEKMSKSLGNFLTIREITKTTHPEILRLMLVSSHYRTPIDYSEEALETSRQTLIRFYEMLERVNLSAESSEESRLPEVVQSFMTSFDEAMCDDFNTARAIACIHELTTSVNKTLNEASSLTAMDKTSMAGAIRLINDVLGILEEEPAAFLEMMKHSGLTDAGLTETDIEAFINERNTARKNRDFKRADEIREILKDKGIQLKDSPAGTTWEKL
ncbi:MAG TPA: cysteine--tRNA ligase [Desulfomonilia bacterium]